MLYRPLLPLASLALVIGVGAAQPADAAWDADDIEIESPHSTHTENEDSEGGPVGPSVYLGGAFALSDSGPGGTPNYADTNANYSYTFVRQYYKNGTPGNFTFNGAGLCHAYAYANGSSFFPSTGAAEAHATLLPMTTGIGSTLSANAVISSSNGPATDEDYAPDNGMGAQTGSLVGDTPVKFKCTAITSTSYTATFGRGIADAQVDIEYPNP